MDKLTDEDLRIAKKAHYNKESSSESETESDVERKCKHNKPPPRKFSFIKKDESEASTDYQSFESKLLYDYNFPDMLKPKRGNGLNSKVSHKLKAEKKFAAKMIDTCEDVLKLKVKKNKASVKVYTAPKTIDSTKAHLSGDDNTGTNNFEANSRYYKAVYMSKQHFYMPIEIVSVIINSQVCMPFIKVFLGIYGMDDFVRITNNIPIIFESSQVLSEEVTSRVVHVLDRTETASNNLLKRDPNGYLICCSDCCHKYFSKNTLYKMKYLQIPIEREVRVADDYKCQEILNQQNKSWKYLKNAMMDYLNGNGNLFDPRASPIKPRLSGFNKPNPNSLCKDCSGSECQSLLYKNSDKKKRTMKNLFASTISSLNLETNGFEKPDSGSKPLSLSTQSLASEPSASKNGTKIIKKRTNTTSRRDRKKLLKQTKIDNNKKKMESKLQVDNSLSLKSICNDDNIDSLVQEYQDQISKESVPYEVINRFPYLDEQEIIKHRNLFVKNLEQTNSKIKQDIRDLFGFELLPPNKEISPDIFGEKVEEENTKETNQTVDAKNNASALPKVKKSKKKVKNPQLSSDESKALVIDSEKTTETKLKANEIINKPKTAIKKDVNENLEIQSVFSISNNATTDTDFYPKIEVKVSESSSNRFIIKKPKNLLFEEDKKLLAIKTLKEDKEVEELASTLESNFCGINQDSFDLSEWDLEKLKEATLDENTYTAHILQRTFEKTLSTLRALNLRNRQISSSVRLSNEEMFQTVFSGDYEQNPMRYDQDELVKISRQKRYQVFPDYFNSGWIFSDDFYKSEW